MECQKSRKGENGMRYSVIAALDGSVYHDEVEADNQEDAEAEARAMLASAWGMTPTLQDALNESDPTLFDAELDGFAVDPAPADDELHALLVDIRAEIARLNAAAGETIFNPALTQLVDARLAEGA
jgi:hypothetical protein